MSEFYVYGLFEDGKEEPFYIGKGKGNRLNQHAQKAAKKESSLGDLPVYRKIRKINYNFEAFKLFENLSEDYAFFIESFLIKKYGKKTQKNGILYNVSDGGDGLSGVVFSEETIKKFKERSSGENNPMWGKRGRLSPLYGKPSGMNGKKHSEETKEKMRKAHKGKKIHPNTLKGLYENNPMHNKQSKENHAKAMKSDLVKEKKSKAVLGDKNPMYGKKQKIVTCPHCGKSGGTGAFHRWHFDNCKLKK